MDKDKIAILPSAKLPAAAILLFMRHNFKALISYSLILFVFLMVVIQGILYSADRRDASNISRSLLGHAVSISKSVSTTITIASENIGVATLNMRLGDSCSDHTLNVLRTSLYRSEYIVDLGVIVDGHVLCTVTAGNFQKPLVLAAPQRRNINGYYDVWRDITDPIDGNIRYNAFGKGNVIALLSKSTFSFLDNLKEIYSVKLETRDRSFVYRDLRVPEVGARPLSAHLPASVQRACDTELDICVTLTNSRPGLFALDALSWSVTVLIAASVSICMVLFNLILRWRYFSPKNFVHNSLLNDDLKISYQPIVRLSDGQLVGAESLLRVCDRYEYMTTERFVATAEAFGFTKVLTISVMRKVIREFSEVLRMRPDLYVTINVPIADLLDCQILEILDAEVKKNGISPEQIILEITERSATDSDAIYKSIDEFKQHGYSFVLDDFGTGHSNFARLTALSIKGVKIDKSLIRMAAQKPFAFSVLSKLLAMVRDIGLTVIVEGIETQRGVDFVLSIDPDARGQGWFWGDAAPIDQFASSYLFGGEPLRKADDNHVAESDAQMTI